MMQQVQSQMPRDSLSLEFARVLRKERLARGMSQESLAHRAGLHPTYVGLVERGLRNPTIQAGHRLARALRVPLSDMLREAEKRA